MDCRSVSPAERVCDCEEGVQCPNDRNPMFFMQAIYAFPVDLRGGAALVPNANSTPRRYREGQSNLQQTYAAGAKRTADIP